MIKKRGQRRAHTQPPIFDGLVSETALCGGNRALFLLEGGVLSICDGKSAGRSEHAAEVLPGLLSAWLRAVLNEG